jgi:hypothetical protein
METTNMEQRDERNNREPVSRPIMRLKQLLRIGVILSPILLFTAGTLTSLGFWITTNLLLGILSVGLVLAAVIMTAVAVFLVS